jgi:ATP synthase F1 gamma subunit
MKLVAAAKVRRAQEAVIRSRPFSETLERILGGLLQRLSTEALDIPLMESREAKKVGMVVVTGDRGLCGGYNAQMIKKAEARRDELNAQVPRAAPQLFPAHPSQEVPFSPSGGKQTGGALRSTPHPR